MNTQLYPLDDKWLEAVIALESLAHSHPWSESLIRKPASSFNHHYVLVENGALIGYFFSQCIAGDASLLNLVIAPSYQKQGYGKKLLLAFIDKMKEANASEIWLEVRESNLGAIKLYESVGFNEFDRRYHYYPTQTGYEDALVMSYWFEE
jgi:ribosomal-protein-alanine N-acetyltransferase